MTDFLTVIEPRFGGWRAAEIDDEGFPVSLQFFDDPQYHPVDALFDARVTAFDAASDLAFLDLGGFDGVMNLQRAKQIADKRVDRIQDCLQIGQMIRVQVIAEPAAAEGKALSVTPRPRLAGRYVTLEHGARLNFSKDLKPHVIGTLKSGLEAVSAHHAVIVRTRASLVGAEAVVREAETFAQALAAPAKSAPGLVYAPSPATACLMAMNTSSADILIDGVEETLAAQKIARTSYPDLADRIKAGKETEGLFEFYGVTEAIDEALSDRIELPCGGWISITPTPALTVVDVNMGGALKGRSAAEAKITVNLEAAMAIAYHLRFQDIGGLIVADFIDMSGKGAAAELMATLDDALRDDPVPVRHSGISNFGLVEFTRKRKGISLRDRMQRARKPVVNPREEALTLLDRALRVGRSGQPGTLILQAPDAVISELARLDTYVEALKTKTSRQLEIQAGQGSDVYLKTN
ncbi:hypothetical protein GCM10017044_10210 [Kordiimonas sediminis]|uniref:S1 motif domain-containing protein n=1 Tax=Kordiimonas sediminis TaxID=1735581 RepID=A0A919AN13_9PROT|nr:ribonuclease E/G [Kordiimonas sediminis]GHF17743.1 hypothetical protein GCM10017044_10210 [Kordiimonas sediminis]